MAQLTDSLGRTTIEIRLRGLTADFLISQQVPAQQQRDEFGQRSEALGCIEVLDIPVDSEQIADFLNRAGDWLALPLAELGSTYLSGEWVFTDSAQGHFCLSLGPNPSTPSKTDWFNAEIAMNLQGLSDERVVQIDQSGLANFVGELRLEFAESVS